MKNEIQAQHVKKRIGLQEPTKKLKQFYPRIPRRMRHEVRTGHDLSLLLAMAVLLLCIALPPAVSASQL